MDKSIGVPEFATREKSQLDELMENIELDIAERGGDSLQITETLLRSVGLEPNNDAILLMTKARLLLRNTSE